MYTLHAAGTECAVLQAPEGLLPMRLPRHGQVRGRGEGGPRLAFWGAFWERKYSTQGGSLSGSGFLCSGQEQRDSTQRLVSALARPRLCLCPSR